MEVKSPQQQSVAKKLEALKNLQQIDLSLDEIVKMRGDLPEEVKDLEDEIAGYQTRLEKHKEELAELEQEVSDKKSAIKESEAMIKKYEEQQMNVRNNREYDAITKEIELQNLEIQISEKRIKEAKVKIEAKKEELSVTEKMIEDRTQDLNHKKEELEVIMAESKDDEVALNQKREEATKVIEPKLLNYYERLRKSLSNGLAVVSVKRGAADGCNILIPPQRIVEIKEKKRIVFDEYSGRILADVDEDEVIEEPKKAKRGRKKA